MKKLQLLIVVVLVLFSIRINAQSWVGANSPSVNRVDGFAEVGTTFFAATTGGVLVSVNNGADWTFSNNGLTNTNINTITVIGNDIIAGTDDGISKSTDIGLNWASDNNALTGKSVIALANNGGNLFAGTSSGVFLSTDKGSNWIEINNGLPSTKVSSFAISGTNIFLGTSNGVFKSTNNGTDWVEINNGLANTSILDIDCCGSNLFAGTSNGIFISTDDGTSWESANYNLSSLTSNTTFTNIAVCGENIYATVTLFGGVTLTTGSKRWNDLLAPFIAVGGFEVLGGRLFEGSIMNAGIMYTLLSPTSAEEETNNLPTSFALEQNYPNPFNPNTKISYQLPVSCQVTLKIFNSLGEVVKTLVDEQKETGRYEIEFNAENIPSGIYFYQLKTGTFMQTKKMMLMK
jgi:hypothetical protein